MDFVVVHVPELAYESFQGWHLSTLQNKSTSFQYEENIFLCNPKSTTSSIKQIYMMKQTPGGLKLKRGGRGRPLGSRVLGSLNSSKNG